MKNSFFLLSFLLFFVACNKSNDPSNSKSLQFNQPNTIMVGEKTIGEYHNSLMKLNYNKLNSLSFMRGIDNSQIITSLQENLKENIMRDFQISSEEYDYLINNILKIQVTTNEDINDVLANRLTVTLSEIAKTNEGLAEDLKTLSEVGKDGDTAYFSLCKDIENKYMNTEYEALISSIVDISVSSYNFWKNKEENNQTSILQRTPPKKDHRSIWQADVSGAVVGGGWGAVTGSFAGGVGAVPGAVLGAGIGSAYGSAAAGIWSYFNN